MDDFISSLCSALSFNSLWGIIGSAVPFIAISVLFCFGLYLIRRIIYYIGRAGATEKETDYSDIEGWEDQYDVSRKRDYDLDDD